MYEAPPWHETRSYMIARNALVRLLYIEGSRRLRRTAIGNERASSTHNSSYTVKKRLRKLYICQNTWNPDEGRLQVAQLVVTGGRALTHYGRRILTFPSYPIQIGRREKNAVRDLAVSISRDPALHSTTRSMARIHLDTKRMP